MDDLVTGAPLRSAIGRFAGFIVVAVLAHASGGPEPLWAYGFPTPPPPGVTPPPPGRPNHGFRANEDRAAQLVPQHVRGSTATYPWVQIRDGGSVPDWFPDEHPPMPPIVAHGRGRPENAPVSGQTTAYFIRQLEDFRSGARHSADPRKPNTVTMIALARAMTAEDEREAAAYFAAIAWRPWTRVVETDRVPTTRIEGNLFIATSTARTEPIAGRIIEVPEDELQANERNPHSGFIAYAPPGSVRRGEILAKTGGTLERGGRPAGPRTIACATCHGPELTGLGDAPAIAGRSPSYLARELYDFQQGARHGALAALMGPVTANLRAEDFVAIAAYVGTLGGPRP
jgi:cytochrome c553